MNIGGGKACESDRLSGDRKSGRSSAAGEPPDSPSLHPLPDALAPIRVADRNGKLVEALKRHHLKRPRAANGDDLG